MRLIVFTLFSVSLASAAPCITANPSCTEWVSLGTAPARALIYRTYSLETRNEAITRALIVVHGAGRDADNYFRNALAAAFLAGALDNTVVIAPRMASAAANCHDLLAPNEISWNCNTWRSGGPAISNPDVTSFDFLDEVLRKVARKEIFPNLKLIVVTGHSAGGQVLNRYEMANQVHDKLGVPVTYVVSNPSSYAWPDSTRPTDAAYSVQAHAPGYIPAIDRQCRGFPPFRRGQGLHDLRPMALRPERSHRLRGEADGRPVEGAAQFPADHLFAGRTRCSSARRIRWLVFRDGSGAHAAGARGSLREICE